jgi:putative transposase
VALDQSALLEVLDALKAAEVDDRIRTAAQTIYQALIEAELTSVIGAAPHERTPERLAQRNGHRSRLLTTSAGDLELRVPKLRAGTFFPSLLERRRRVDQALFAVVMEAYLHGVSTRKVDDLVRAWAPTAASPRARSAASAPTWTARSQHSGTGRWPARSFPRLRRRDLVQGQATAASSPRRWSWPPGSAAMAAARSSASPSVTARMGGLWTAFLRSLKARGLQGVQLVIADAHLGLRQAVAAVMAGRPSSAAESTSSETCSPRCPRARPRWSPRLSGPSSPNPTPPTSMSSWT